MHRIRRKTGRSAGSTAHNARTTVIIPLNDISRANFSPHLSYPGSDKETKKFPDNFIYRE
jgi:hypothetical protein